MLTGDNRTTAEAVAGRLGISPKSRPRCCRRTSTTVVRRLRTRATSSPWRATASTTPPRWPRPMSASPWAPAPRWRSQSAGITLVKGDLAGIVRATAAQPRHHAQHPPEPVFAFVYNAIGIPIAAGVLYPVVRHAAQPDHSGAGHVVQFRLGDRQRAAAAPPPTLSIETLLQPPARYVWLSIRGRTEVALHDNARSMGDHLTHELGVVENSVLPAPREQRGADDGSRPRCNHGVSRRRRARGHSQHLRHRRGGTRGSASRRHDRSTGDVSRQVAAVRRDRHAGSVGRAEYAPDRGCGVPSDQPREIWHRPVAPPRRTRVDRRRFAIR